ncbi:MAG: DNA/RNA nuclease SfsA [Spirochaetales bacterium]|nr:DNA/RNA nuclease SfsA [Spirochaetales bacterium]
MKLFTNSLEGHFLERPNRFIVIARTKKGIIRAHCPNPGRMLELLSPGRTIILEQNRNPSRKTGYTLVAAYYRNNVIPLYSARANKVVRNLVLPILFPEVRDDAQEVKSEITLDTSRFDFCVHLHNRFHYIEVKSCTLVENGIGMFPDAPTTRGRRHVEELTALAHNYGNHYKGHVVFLISHPDCRLFVPNIHTDPLFSLALREGGENLSIHAVSIKTTPEGDAEIASEDIPVNLSPVEWIVKDSGSYVLILRIKNEREIRIGSLGLICFKSGYYCYSGSALRNLHHRINRHVRKRKKNHWHIDYLLESADSVKAYPIYNPVRLECKIAREIGLISNGEIKGFGSSDCGCGSHLHYFKNNPEEMEAFIPIIFKYRHFYGLM